MTKKEKFKFYLIGFLIGCLIVSCVWKKRKESAPKTTATFLAPWQGRPLFFQDQPEHEDDSWRRTRIIIDPGTKGPIRLEETLVKDHLGRSQVITRKVTAANRVIVKTAKPCTQDTLEEILKKYNYQIESSSRKPPIYLVQVGIVDEQTDPVALAIHTLIKEKPCVEQVFPEYLPDVT